MIGFGLSFRDKFHILELGNVFCNNYVRSSRVDYGAMNSLEINVDFKHRKPFRYNLITLLILPLKGKFQVRINKVKIKRLLNTVILDKILTYLSDEIILISEW